MRFEHLALPRPVDAHKGTLGTVGIIGGASGMTGAAVLAAISALKGGCGKVIAGFHQAQLPLPYLPEYPEIMLDISRQIIHRNDISAYAVGCGLSTADSAMQVVDFVLFDDNLSHIPIVLDADALTLLARIQKRLPSERVRILTPHMGEASRLLGCSIEHITQNKQHCAHLIAQKYQSIVVLKGNNSIIGAPDGQTVINNSGNPNLATAGSGDVLAGLIASLLAQKIPPFESACAAVWLHGKAGDILAQNGISIGLCAGELPNTIRQIRHQIIQERR